MLQIGLGRRGKIQRSMEGAWGRIYCYTLGTFIAIIWCCPRGVQEAVLAGLRPGREQANIAKYVPIRAERLISTGYQLNDRGLVECKVGVIRPQPFLI